MPDQFKQHIAKFVPITEAEFTGICTYFNQELLQKKEQVLSEGQTCKKKYFVLSGCMRMFFINEKGAEQTTQFAIEQWWLADLFSFIRQQPSSFAIQALEKTEVLSITATAYAQLLNDFPFMETYFRQVYQITAAAAQMRVKFLYGYSKEELYLQFSSNFPEFVQRVPQYLLANYLGCTPEYISEIRAKRRS
ncbi:Crp/Fnr family transcriptional regulator [Taibaiella sp. KBW10]|uniref:Crp/Fnr family transcriptional regulator n=1 Tax=Taibaiella sp. KBW10 TaxID=2153357 RepID=UPI000F5B27BB|nr:Crp/Fnr family transcriptional regulator [Taibaiella sp. KBW10]RQO31266.1 Crp/Fnr family transcriptional regulator [Taibaiella sp. KBW10]